MQQALAGLCAGPAAAAQTNERAAWRQAPSHHVQQVASSRRPSRCNAAATAARPPPLPAADAAAALQPELLLSLQPPAAATAAAAAQQPEQLLCPKLLALQRSCAASSLSADKASREQQERLVNQGAAIRALQRDLPAILDSEPSDLSIYCEGVLFEDRLSPRMGLPAASCQGRDAYARLLWSLRFHRMLFFRQAKVGEQGCGGRASAGLPMHAVMLLQRFLGPACLHAMPRRATPLPTLHPLLASLARCCAGGAAPHVGAAAGRGLRALVGARGPALG